MWDKLQNAASHPVVVFLKKLCGDPIQLYAVFLMVTIMNYYHSSMCWLYTIVSLFLSHVMIKFYDFVERHKWIGPLCYMGYLFVGLLIVSFLIRLGEVDYPIHFVVWFLTPQSVVSFSIWYTLAIYLLMLGFLTSSVYYFSKISYRMVMQFLIMLIPLSMYGKEGIQMPALLVILLLSSYFLLMIYCRQLKESPYVRRLSNFNSGMSIAVYVLSFSILAAVIPKPTIRANRNYIESVLSYSTLSDRLMDAISSFTRSTDNSFAVSNNSRIIYYVKAPSSLRLRTQTYCYYEGEFDSWNVIEDYDYPDTMYYGTLTYAPSALLQAILDAAEADAEFAEEYDLSEYAGMELPEQELESMSIYKRIDSTMLPAPTRVHQIGNGGWMEELRVSAQNTIHMPNAYGMELYYYPETYARREEVSDILQRLNHVTYAQLLEDAAVILEDSDQEASELLEDCLEEQKEAYGLLQVTQACDFQSDVVSDLAAEITEGLTSDYEKARAIERYFTEEDFVYDMSYQKDDGDNVETFLTESKRGVCYEFATAMVLMCRASGLPARYVQGYNMSEQRQSNADDYNYVIKVRDAHAFAEVYISGYGWLSFEPTVASDGNTGTERAENHYVMLWGFALLGAALLAGAGYLLLPHVKEKWFRSRLVRKTPEAAAAACFKRMRETLDMHASDTVMELAERSAPFYQEIQLFEQMDALLYGPVPAVTTQQLAGAYVKWQECWKKHVKEVKKQQREAKKAMRRNRS